MGTRTNTYRNRNTGQRGMANIIIPKMPWLRNGDHGTCLHMSKSKHNLEQATTDNVQVGIQQ
eukprot:2036772-Ditylum_brightwellii.AAC.1